MQDQIMFQGHEFTLREDGLYETKDAFEFDDADWAEGENYPGYIVLLRKYNNRECPRLLAVDKHHSDLIQPMHSEEFSSICVSNAVPMSITFQGHVFTRREDGLYETSDKFEFDEKDWNHGYQYRGYAVLLRHAGDKEFPYLIATDDAYANVITAIYDKNGRVDNIKKAPSFSVEPCIVTLFETGEVE